MHLPYLSERTLFFCLSLALVIAPGCEGESTQVTSGGGAQGAPTGSVSNSGSASAGTATSQDPATSQPSAPANSGTPDDPNEQTGTPVADQTPTTPSSEPDAELSPIVTSDTSPGVPSDREGEDAWGPEPDPNPTPTDDVEWEEEEEEDTWESWPEEDTTESWPEEDSWGPEPSDPCDPNPCTTPPQPTCDGDYAVSYAEVGWCYTIDAEEAFCDYETVAYDYCDWDEICVSGACVNTQDPEDYDFGGPTARVTTLGLAEDDPGTSWQDEGDCCFDFDGDGEADNGMGGLLGSLGSFLGDGLGDEGVNGMIQEALNSAQSAIILQAQGFNDYWFDDTLTLAGLLGYSISEEGGYYYAQPQSFGPGGVLRMSFGAAQVIEGTMTAGPTSIEFPLPIGEGVLWVPMQNAQIRVEEAYAEGTYLELYGGTIGGLIPLQTVVDAVNMAVGECACLGLFGADALELAAEDKLSCSNNFTAANPWCDDQDGSFCVSMSDNKGLVCTAIGIIKPDIDTDSSGKKDAFSVGMYFSATDSVSVGGLGEDQEGSLGLGGCGDCSGGGSPMNALAQLALFLLCFVAVTRRRVT